MRKIPCLNLSERMNTLNYQEDIHSTVHDFVKESGYTAFHRVYVGSSFCIQYFLSTTKECIRKIRSLCEQEQRKITLVIPLVTQKNLLNAKEKIQDIVLEAGEYLDEITVNDFGMLSYVSNNFDRKINLGRLFMKDYRDKRFEEYFKMPLKPKIINQIMMEFIRDYKVSGLEFDLTHREIDLIDVPSYLMVGFHYPYCYQTVGHICEAASTQVSIDQKFRPSHVCHLECEEQLLTYHTEEAIQYFKRGRAVFFENTDCEIKNREEIRLIYTPKFREVNLDESISSIE